MQAKVSVAPEKTSQFRSFQDKNSPSEWRVESIDIKHGDALVAVFSGPEAQEMAAEYARFKNGQ